MEPKAMSDLTAKSKEPSAPGPDPRLTLRPFGVVARKEGQGDDERFEVQFLEEIIRRDPCYEEALMLLGHAYTRRGEYDKGLDVDRRLVRLRPADPEAYYNLACSLSLVRRLDEAFAALQEAIRRGCRDASLLLRDPDLANLREDARFAEVMRQVGTNRPATS